MKIIEPTKIDIHPGFWAEKYDIGVVILYIIGSDYQLTKEKDRIILRQALEDCIPALIKTNGRQLKLVQGKSSEEIQWTSHGASQRFYTKIALRTGDKEKLLEVLR